MRTFKSIIAIAIAIFFISNINRKSDNRLAAPEEIIKISDHSECEALMASAEAENQRLRMELAEAQRSFSLILQVEIEFVPGFFGDWAVVSFQSAPIPVSAAAARSLSEGDNLCGSAGTAVMDCRIIVAEITAAG